MPIAPKQYPVRFTAKGLVDALDATDKFPGACIQLVNLIFDPANPEIMVSRPGVTNMTSFPGFISPGFVSVQATIGDLVFGMIATGRNAGKDEPFCYDHSAGAFIAVGNVLNANTPTSPSSTGAWTPPTIAAVGTMIIVTHPGFPGGATKFGWFDVTNPAAPVWNAGDTATNGLPSVPLCVANFNNRAYFGCGNLLEFTDTLTNPPTRTNATQFLTIDDKSNITALSGLPLQTTSSGVVQALLVFKAFQVWQITGDGTTLAQNYLSLSFGTQAPRSVQQAPLGVYFHSQAGPKIVDQWGVVRSVTFDGKSNDSDVKIPWQNAVTPSRISAAYSNDIYRICMETVINGVQGFNDYWFDESRRRWTGPHSFAYDCASQHDDHFILSSSTNAGQLIHSYAYPAGSAAYTDLGAALMSTLQSSTFPKTGDMEMKQVVESTIELASNQGPASYGITGQDDLGNTLNSCSVSVLPAGALWGSGVWGGFAWSSSTNKPTTYTVPWSIPLVFKKMALYITVAANTAIALGTFFARYQNAGYTNNR